MSGELDTAASASEELAWEKMVGQVADHYDTSREADALVLAAGLLRAMSREFLHSLAVKHLVDAARDLSRRRALTVERGASRAEPPQQGQVDLAAGLWKGRYRHGVMNKRTGAARNGCNCDECEKARANDLRLYMTCFSQASEKMTKIFEDLSAQMRMQWTEELLATPFALPNGDRVTWGSATVAQHEERVEMFKGQVTAGAEGAARHMAAIRDIEALGARCLAEAVDGGHA